MLSQQQRDLVACRNALQKVLGLSRRHAALTAGKLSEKQVHAVLAAGNDQAKVQKAVEPEAKPEPAPEAKPTTPKPPKK